MPESGSRSRGFSYPTMLGLVVMLGWGLVIGNGAAGPTEPRTTLHLAGGRAAVPATPRGLPRGIEALAPYVPQSSCDPAAKPGVLAFGRLLSATYPGTHYGIARACAFGGLASEHYEGRALDWMSSMREPGGAARVDAVLGWLLGTDSAGNRHAMARRLGIMYIIWNGRIWGAYASASGWRPYSTCAAHPQSSWDTTCHRDHVHFSFSWAGAWGRTSFWTRKVAANDYGPCRPPDLNWAAPSTRRNPTRCRYYPAVTAPAGSSATARALARYSGATIRTGSTGPIVTAVQRALGASPDGDFGPRTAAAVSAFRATHGLRAGTVVDAPTWRALLAAYVTGPGATAAGRTSAADRAATAGSGGSGSPSRAGNALTRYKGTVLHYGSRGAAVSAVQRALGVRPLSGWFGPVTRTAVIRFQRAHHIRTTGNVGPLTWAALGA